MRSFPGMTMELNVKVSGKNWNCLPLLSLKPVCVFASFPLTRAHVSLIVIRSYCWCQSGILRNYGDGVSPTQVRSIRENEESSYSNRHFLTTPSIESDVSASWS